jgi:hypothetical protein
MGRSLPYHWESAELSGLPLIDEIRHLLSVGYLVVGWNADAAMVRLQRQAATPSMGLPRHVVLALRMIYLLDYPLRLYGEEYDDNYPRAVWCRALLMRLNATAAEVCG